MSGESTIFLIRNRAEALKSILDRTLDPGARRMLLDMVQDYDNVADILARIEQTQRVVAKRIPL